MAKKKIQSKRQPNDPRNIALPLYVWVDDIDDAGKPRLLVTTEPNDLVYFGAERCLIVALEGLSYGQVFCGVEPDD